MELGIVGLGRMGGNMARRLIHGGHKVVGFAHSAAAVALHQAQGGVGVQSPEALVAALAPPRAVWLMVPAGAATEESVEVFGKLLAKDDILIDGGNTYFKDDVRRAAALASKGIHYVDVGTSGGVWGLTRGYCLMIGGPKVAVARLEPVFRSLAPGKGDTAPVAGREGKGGTAEDGFLHCGPVGAGHFVKMVHNGIEYGMMQAYAEGFELMRGAAGVNVPEVTRYDLDLADIAELWRRGSVIPSWLLDLAAAALADDQALEGFTGRVDDSGEGRWTVMTAIEEGVSLPVLTASLFTRFRSRAEHTFGEKLLSAMRHGFGGHVETK
ncbi:MAG: decarboxylating 6-phosphogluconate dehydrogenase [Deltaproteobacteria bacterium]|nr:decarboxylating 6-phosphogluconate dehydrogenase [Deltaproteobacteria bacterium]